MPTRRRIPQDMLGDSSLVALARGELVFDAARGWLRYGDGAAPGGYVVPRANLSNLEAVDTPLPNDRSYYPLGNAPATRTRMAFSASSKWDGEREFMHSLAMSSTHGGAGDPTFQWDKCVSYMAHNIGGRVRNAWVGNKLLGISPPAAGSAYNYVNIEEFDVNNLSGIEFGAAIGQAGLSAPSVHGLTVNGLGKPVTSGITLISSNGDGSPLYQFGFVATGTKQADFLGISKSSVCIWSNGTNEYGGLFDGTYAKGAICVPNNKAILGRTSAGADCAIVSVDAQNSLHVGDGLKLANVIVDNTALPGSDNLYQLGSAVKRWTSIWAANGTIQTSDPTLKTDITSLSACDTGAVIDAIDPILFRWRSGGTEMVLEDVVQTVQDTVSRTVTIDSEAIVDGVLVRTPTAVTVDEPQWDDVPVVDADGAPVTQIVRRPKLDAAGRPVTMIVRRPAMDEAGNPQIDAAGDPVLERTEQPVLGLFDDPVSKRVPRMVTKAVPTMVPRDVPGKRLHAGFDASQIERVAGLLGTDDFGGFVRAEGGELAIRPDQLVPILWAELRSLRARVATLEGGATAPPWPSTDAAS